MIVIVFLAGLVVGVTGTIAVIMALDWLAWGPLRLDD